MANEVVPQLGLNSFSCPHCGALAHQNWYAIWGKPYGSDTKPNPSRSASMTTGQSQVTRAIAIVNITKAEEVHSLVGNLFLSRCYSCRNLAVWLGDGLVHPLHTSKIEPHPDIPANIKDDFTEAAAIVKSSPRGSAALSRLILQKLMIELGEKGDNINEDIGSLVKKGLEVEIQQALDVVRVVGNNAVHPGTIDLKDDAGIALALLQLINLVVERQISTKKRLAEMFANLPPGARQQIEKRDSGVVLTVLKEDEKPTDGS
jgi:Domain of unknown function (DUF4145)